VRLALNVGLIAAFAFAAQVVGLFVSAAAYLAVHMLALGVRPALALPVAAGAALALYAFFGLLLGVEMRGAWLL
jgi:hypothetical protein